MAVSPDGLFALTASADCALRAHDICATGSDPWWMKGASHEPPLFEVPATEIHDKPICALAISVDSRSFASGCEDGFVRIFRATVNAPDSAQADAFCLQHLSSELVQACARFGAPVRAVDFSPTGAFLAAAGDEPGVIKVVMTAQPSTVNVMRATSSVPMGMQPMCSLLYDPDSEYLLSIGTNGAAAVWDVSAGQCMCALELNNRKVLCASWAPDGSQLIVGTATGAVFVQRGVWNFHAALEDSSGDDSDQDGMASDVEARGDGGVGAGSAGAESRNAVVGVAWSKNSRYILTARSDKCVRLWDVTSMKVVAVWQAESVPQAVKWHPTANAFMVFDSLGQFVVVPDAVPAQLPPAFCGNGVGPAVELPIIPEKTPADASESRGGDSSCESSSADDDDDDEGVRRRGPKRRSSDRSADQRVSEDVTDDDAAGRSDILFDADDVDADDEEDAAQLRLKRLDERERRGYEDPEDARRRRRKRRRERQHQAWLAENGKLTPSGIVSNVPAPFMPSATRAIPGEETRKRILVWNLTAAVISHDEKSHNIVDIEFADSTRRPIGIKDHFDFSLSCVNETGILLACPKSKSHSSIVSFRPFSSWSSNSDWTQPLSAEESASTIALGGRFAAVSSDRNMVRLFSLSGLQTDVFGTPGRVVTMAAAQSRLAVVYAFAGVPAYLRFQVYEVAGNGEVTTSIASGEMVLSPEARLEWLGFASDTKDLMSYDSLGCVWVHNRTSWVPMLQNAAKAADCQWFWITAASSTAVVGAQCFGDEKFPPASPRPALRKVRLLAPVIDQLTKGGQSTVEERLFRARISLSRAREAKLSVENHYDEDDDAFEDATEDVNNAAKDLDKCLLALMEVACRKEHSLRAFDIATRLSSCISLKYAVNLANHYKRFPLAGRIEEVYRRRADFEMSSGVDTKGTRKVSPAETSPTTPTTVKKGNVESCDDSSGREDGSDNEEVLPAPTEGHRDSKFQLGSKQGSVAKVHKVASSGAKRRRPTLPNRFAKKAK